jgi:tetratricopeptide (TPR) repeat protein
MNTGKYNNLIAPPQDRAIRRFKNEKHNKAAAGLLESVRKNPDDPMRYVKLHYRFGQIYRKEGSLKEAENQYLTALAINPFDARAQNSLAEIYAATGQTDKAISTFKKLKTMSEDNPEIDYNLACLYARQGNIEQSINWLKKAIANGYNRWSVLRSDKDLDSIRGTSEYQILIKGSYE